MSTNNIFDKGANFIFRTIYKIQKSENDKKLAKLAHPDYADIELLLKMCSSFVIEEDKKEFCFYVNTKENIFNFLKIFGKYGLKLSVFLSDKMFGNKLVGKINEQNHDFVYSIYGVYIQSLQRSLDKCGAMLEQSMIQNANNR